MVVVRWSGIYSIPISHTLGCSVWFSSLCLLTPEIRSNKVRLSCQWPQFGLRIYCVLSHGIRVTRIMSVRTWCHDVTWCQSHKMLSDIFLLSSVRTHQTEYLKCQRICTTWVKFPEKKNKTNYFEVCCVTILVDIRLTDLLDKLT